ncbi:TetR/AcrR family transcriptional regulator C-terminal domain-containing protein [Nonomuraea sediminis]|uniref:TetR/AcrR family transcriptional regulator C-terminal domain-containing protein n=1 Tax=Nonomuraea sediminis TaxID=2835864 RepID=UPI001BDC8DCC|nr:TetR/AcrR family transcriptional regulator C-terminal domain-containing protein [Nonomuraea sediminis]
MQKYAEIVAELKRRIAEGELQAGDRVPSTRQLAREWGVALATATKALNALSQEGVVRAEPRVGTVVSTGRRPRREGGEVTRDRIIRAAIEIADAEGLEALGMRGLAAKLGIATMTLYRHVPGKEELVVLMVDAVMEEFPLPDPAPEGWRARLEASARVQWAGYRAHPWMAGITSLTRPLPSPSLLKHAEWQLAALDGHGLSPETMLYVHILHYSYVQGIAANLELEAEAEAATGLTDEEWMETQEAHISAIVSSGSYPTFARTIADMGGDFDLNLDELFEIGLGPMLDGLASIVERRSR